MLKHAAANDPLYYARDAAALDLAGCRLVTALLVVATFSHYLIAAPEILFEIGATTWALMMQIRKDH